MGFCFATLAVRGTALARHFEVDPTQPAPPPPGDPARAPFRIREVSSARLSPGHTTTLTRARANIHAFTAGPSGATLIEFGVRFPDPGAGPDQFSVVEIAEAPTLAAERSYDARWLGNIYAD